MAQVKDLHQLGPLSNIWKRSRMKLNQINIHVISVILITINYLLFTKIDLIQYGKDGGFFGIVIGTSIILGFLYYRLQKFNLISFFVGFFLSICSFGLVFISYSMVDELFCKEYYCDIIFALIMIWCSNSVHGSNLG